MTESAAAESGAAVASGGLGSGARHNRHSSSTEAESGHIAKQPTETSQKKNLQPIRDLRQDLVTGFKNNWKWWLLGLFIFLAILLPIVQVANSKDLYTGRNLLTISSFKIILPSVVQLIVNQQSLPILGGSFLFQGTDSMLINLNSSFRSPLPASVDSFPLQLYNRETSKFSPWLKLQVPQLKVNGATKFKVDDQVQKLTDGEEFSKWFAKFIDQDNVNVDVRGNGTTIKLGALESKPLLDKGIEMQGLNLRRGIILEHLQLVLPAADGNNVKGMLTIPNKSPITVGIGDCTLGVFVADIQIGDITIHDTILKPGNNSQSFQGSIDLSVLATNLGPILKVQSPALADGKLELNVTGQKCIIHGERLTYIENVLNHRTLVVRGSVATLLADIVSGVIAPQSNPGSSPHQGSTFISAVSTVFGNKTLMGKLANNWNKTQNVAKKRQSFAGTDEFILGLWG